MRCPASDAGTRVRLIAGLPGASVAALGTFLRRYLFTVIPAPWFKKYGMRPGLLAFIDGVTAAAVGAITGAVVVLGCRSIVDLPTALSGAGRPAAVSAADLAARITSAM